MTHTCSHCQKGFDTQESLQQHVQAKHTSEAATKSRIKLKHYFILIALGVALFLFAYSVYSYTQKPGDYDAFAKCLTEKGAIVYGNDACQYTNRQLNFFGNSKKYLNYVKCSENRALCDQKGVKTTPTWEFNGQTYPQVQAFVKLASITGCKLE